MPTNATRPTDITARVATLREDAEAAKKSPGHGLPATKCPSCALARRGFDDTEKGRQAALAVADALEALDGAHEWIKQQEGSFCSDGKCTAGPAGTPYACSIVAAMAKLMGY